MKASNSASDIAAKAVPSFRKPQEHVEIGVEREPFGLGFLREPVDGFRCELVEAWVHRLNIP
jgi:hypothetical protein